MTTVLHLIFWTIQAALAFYLLLPTFFLLVYGIKRLLGLQASPYAKAAAKPQEKEYSFAAIITAHKSLQLVPPLVDSLLRQTYRNFKVYVVADACDRVDVQFNDPNVIVLQPPAALNAKIKSIDFAINNFVEAHDALIIFDTDNLVRPDYLAVLNTYFNLGYRAVQTNMLPKNTDSLMSRLDAAGNLYYNFVDRRMRMELGMSAHIWGLGIAIETALYRSVVYNNFLGGFDKKVQADIVTRVPVLAYAEEAVVYDEKIESGEALEKQRTRWLHAYFKYFRYAWDVLWKGLRTFNFNLVFFGLQLMRPPLLLQLGAAFICLAISLFTGGALVWAAIIALFIITFFAIVRVMSHGTAIVKALLYLPVFMYYQARALLRIKKASKTYLKTENTQVVYIEDLLKRTGH
ncbi:glycosyltransferase family 2 protein [Chitinophaga sp.]|uniref:glycosyltransferase family 2 protein n=1 Tax=Chitinophaga sp. TaxID=1869181 RepID=UPI0031D3DDF4